MRCLVRSGGRGGVYKREGGGDGGAGTTGSAGIVAAPPPSPMPLMLPPVVEPSDGSGTMLPASGCANGAAGSRSLPRIRSVLGLMSRPALYNSTVAQRWE
eukprot:NODE_30116_length_427_cov_1.616667.p2 GENE.NODE_30116_length_427_cov_1.616667~~NODE_30116_length_427_cov_1.616667.p2  ORF type:complete len:100 (+),score=9.68 NODE_30116_length_427_cov_1.616667:47-346(+)